MLLKRTIPLLILWLPFLLVACDSYDEVSEPADVEVPEHSPRLVVDGYLFAGQPSSVRLYRTVPVWNGPVDDDLAQRARLEAAEVELHGNGQAVRLQETEPGRYVGTEAVESGTVYRLVVESESVAGSAGVTLPVGTPEPALVGRYLGYEDEPIPGTSIQERTHRFAWTVTLRSGDQPRYYALFWKRDDWDEVPTDQTTKLVRVLPGQAAMERTFEDELYTLQLDPSDEDPYADTTLARGVLCAEIDSTYYLRLLADPSDYNANLPTNVESGAGILAGIVADSLRAEVRTGGE